MRRSSAVSRLNSLLSDSPTTSTVNKKGIFISSNGDCEPTDLDNGGLALGTDGRLHYYPNDPHYTTLVFAGGAAHITDTNERLQALEKNDPAFNIKKITRVVGSSAGALAAILVASGRDYQGIEELLATFPGNKIKDWSFEQIFRFYKTHSICKGEVLKNWLKSLLKELTGKKEPTFLDLKNCGFKDIHIIASDLTHKKFIDFNTEDSDMNDASVLTALLASMAIPFFFPSILYKGMCLVDALISGLHYPTRICNFAKYISDLDGILPPHMEVVNHGQVGLICVERTEAKNLRGEGSIINNLFSYIMHVINFLFRRESYYDSWARNSLLTRKERESWIQTYIFSPISGIFDFDRTRRLDEKSLIMDRTTKDLRRLNNMPNAQPPAPILPAFTRKSRVVKPAMCRTRCRRFRLSRSASIRGGRHC